MSLQPEISSWPTVVRPSPRQFLSGMGVRLRGLRALLLGTAVLLIGLYVQNLALRRGEPASVFPLFVTAILILAAVGAAAIHAAYFARAKIAIHGDRIEKYDLIGSKMMLVSDVSAVQRLSVTSIGPPGRIAVVLTPNNQSIFVMWMAYWAEAECEALWRSIGVPVRGSYSDLLPYGSLSSKYPAAPNYGFLLRPEDPR